MLPIGKLASTILKDVMVINYLSLLKLGLYIGYFCCNCICVLFLRFNESVFLFLVYGFQNNLAPTSVSVLTTSGANVNANLGGTGAV